MSSINIAMADDAIIISTATPAINQTVTVTFLIPSDGVATHTMKIVSNDGSVNLQQDTNAVGGSFVYLNLSFNQAKTLQLTCSLFAGTTKVSSNDFNISVSGDNTPNTSVVLTQTGVNSGIPVIQASINNGLPDGTYVLVLTNQKTQASFSQVLPNDGKSVSFVPTVFSESGPYSYLLQLNGNAVSNGAIQLDSTKKALAVLATLTGSTLTLNITNGDDYINRPIQIQSGSYSDTFTLAGANMIKAFTNVSGTGSKLSLSTSAGSIIEVPVNISIDSVPGTQTSDQLNQASSQDPVRDANKITISLDKDKYNANDVMTAKVSVSESHYASRSVTLKLSADESSVIKMMTLDRTGYAEAIVKLNVPLNSSNKVNAVLYAINGDTINSESASYSLEGQVASTIGTTSSNAVAVANNTSSYAASQPIAKETGKSDYVKTDGQFSDNTPSVDYVAVDLTTLESKKVTIAWYRANHVQLYTTKLIVTNTTTHDQHSYNVRIPNGDGKAKLDLLYDGSGVYTWILISGGKTIAQAPYSVAIGLNKAGVLSQGGLPVILPAVNVPFDQPQAIGSRPDEINGANLGDVVGVTTELVNQNEQRQTKSDQSMKSPKPITASQKTSKNLLVIGWSVAVTLVLGALTFVVLRRRRGEI
jgi:hypothetical protein